jgi:glutamate--glyoxylate aminotransferase
MSGCCCLCCAGGTLVPYMLDEEKNWAMSMDSLRDAVKKARSEGKAVRGLVFINPGAQSMFV